MQLSFVGEVHEDGNRWADRMMTRLKSEKAERVILRQQFARRKLRMMVIQPIIHLAAIVVIWENWIDSPVEWRHLSGLMFVFVLTLIIAVEARDLWKEWRNIKSTESNDE